MVGVEPIPVATYPAQFELMSARALEAPSAAETQRQPATTTTTAASVVLLVEIPFVTTCDRRDTAAPGLAIPLRMTVPPCSSAENSD